MPKPLQLLEPGEATGGNSPPRYPRSGSASARIIECLEAEPATLEEIAEYVGKSRGNTKSLLNLLRVEGVVVRCGEMRWTLVDPIAASVAYFSPGEDHSEG